MIHALRKLVALVVADRGWTIVHEDHRRHVCTLERDRRFFRGPYLVATHERIARESMEVHW